MTRNLVWQAHHVTRENHASQKKQTPCILWFTGLSGAGKSSIAAAVEKKLYELGHHTYLLDGDNIRHGINQDLGFSNEDREENIRRVGEISKLFVDAGLIVLTALISPFHSDRKKVRELVNDNEFIEIHIDTPIDICEQRDSKGLYKKARKGEIKNFTGVDSTYELPEHADITIDTIENDIDMCANIIIDYLYGRHIISIVDAPSC